MKIQMVTIARGAASATKGEYRPIWARIDFFGVHPEYALLKKIIIIHSIAVTCMKGMVYSHKCGKKKDHAKVCNLLHLKIVMFEG